MPTRSAAITLVELLDIPALSELERAIKLLPVNAPVLRYLIVDKKLSSLSSLLKWFQSANGILDMKLPGRVGPIERLLLDDAFKRGNFLSVRHNVDSAIGALGHRTEAQLGRQPPYDDTQARQAYGVQYELTRSELTAALLADMTRLLEATSGVLFESFLTEVDPDPAAFERRLAAISPLIDELIAGRGPSRPHPSQAELEAVGLVYGVDPSNVSRHWRHVVGREADIAGLKLASSYPMRWKQSHRELRPDARLDDRGFSALSKISDLAHAFNRLADMDMEQARTGLRPSRITDEAADLPGLAQHLAVVCALLLADANVATMLERWESAQGAIAGGQAALQLIAQTQSFFAIALEDAVAQQLPARLARMSDVAARQLAERLEQSSDEAKSQGARQHLQDSVQAVVAKLKRVGGAWAKKQDDKFASAEDGHATTALVGVVTKTPAAFFSKFAAALCTKADTDMWNEERHSHLVVFDPVRRRFAGMAMLYVQPFAEIDTERPTLIIRALNPMESLATGHETTSIVDAFVTAAIELARANDLAAVALPRDDSHLLSNVRTVEVNLSERFVRPSIRSRRLYERIGSDGWLTKPWEVAATFDGYAHGHGRVSSLHVFWRRPEPGSDAAQAGDE